VAVDFYPPRFATHMRISATVGEEPVVEVALISSSTLWIAGTARSAESTVLSIFTMLPEKEPHA
jgi:hypothetical protein